jgi:hypothetical protein
MRKLPWSDCRPPATCDKAALATEPLRYVLRLAELGLSGEVKLPVESRPSSRLLASINERMEAARARFEELARSRTGEERLQRHLVELLERWFVSGRRQAPSRWPA